MQIVHSDAVFRVPPGSTPDYAKNNPLLRVLGLIEQMQLAAEREFYVAEQLQYLIPYDYLELYGPSQPNENVLDPAQQDFKTDFQKQNVREFRTTDAHVIRGLVSVDNWTGPFIRLSYRGGPDSILSERAQHALGPNIKAWVKIGNTATNSLITIPYNEASDRYEVELWGFPGSNLAAQLDAKGRAALGRGDIQVRSDLVKGSVNDFRREDIDEQYLVNVAPENSMHPVLPLHIEVAWADESEQFWDSKDGANYQYEFNMILRGWDNYLKVGMSPNPHGGVNFLEYRNLMSNYFEYEQRPELLRRVQPWMLDAYGQKSGQTREEKFMSVDYMDLHIISPVVASGCIATETTKKSF